eukprot:GHVU01129292.1.p2 GENE.GHVU01129292.1~~GHVU01129292.1.p2  ORF type:complete len:102 (-),score=13.12 GHVU01129292.1:884-1189(-)
MMPKTSYQQQQRCSSKVTIGIATIAMHRRLREAGIVTFVLSHYLEKLLQGTFKAPSQQSNEASPPSLLPSFPPSLLPSFPRSLAFTIPVPLHLIHSYSIIR